MVQGSFTLWQKITLNLCVLKNRKHIEHFKETLTWHDFRNSVSTALGSYDRVLATMANRPTFWCAVSQGILTEGEGSVQLTSLYLV
jgi:hypothetical protein